jgi:hypothetical protein
MGGLYEVLLNPQGEVAVCLDDLRLPPFENPNDGDDGERGTFWVGVGDRCDLLEE